MRKMTQSQLDEWNEWHPVGRPCQLIKDDNSEVETHTRTKAWLLGSGHAVVCVNGFSGGWDLDRVKMASLIKA